ncbi:MAG TPA: hypothetical protein VH044_01275 [Polyangiaceae bacterium]|jgi:hypothetical protein|nr:hypothetical protein [Polyangiaceae bacterium]
MGKISVLPDGIGDRATVRPPFDPQEFARQSERATLPPPTTSSPSDAPELVSGSMEVVWPVEGTSIPRLAVAREDLEWFELPPQARRLLEHVDGAATVETISGNAGVAITDATELFDELVREGIVTA